MTKPVTSVAAMMLVEEGKLDLAAPVHRYLPEFKGTTVAVETRDAATGKTGITYEPQKRPMIVEDLLRHTAGMIHGVGKASGDLPVLDFEKGVAITVVPTSSNEFFIDSGDHTRIAFVSEDGSKATGMVLNPGPWQITGHRIN